jgi:hypothetical protein
MRAIVAVLLVAVLGGCARKAQVNTAPAPVNAKVSFHMTNNLGQPVNVYVTSGGADILVGQVAANSTRTLTVTGVASGTTVSLKATAADGTRTYTRDDVILTGSLNWSVP